ncbi:MAG: RDD family protein [Ectothiorhodospiraceae bacterium]|nr:RDD family protein [Ectothiorhodospiraceae bacterium]
MQERIQYPSDNHIQLRGGDEAGVDLEIAGLGSRSYAYIADLHIRVLFVLVWIFIWTFVFFGGSSMFAVSPWVTILPPVLFYFLYHPVLEIISSGRTPGKRLAGIRVVAADGRPASVGAHLLRNVFRLIDSLPTAYLVGFTISLFHRHALRLGDMAAGTVLIKERRAKAADLADATTALNHSSLAPEQQAVVADLLERWTQLRAEHRSRLAETLLQRLQQPLPEPTGNARLRDHALRRQLERLLKGELA